MRHLMILWSALCAVWLTSTSSANDTGPAVPDDAVCVSRLDGKWLFEAQTIGGWALPQTDREAIWVEIKEGAFFRCGAGGLRSRSQLTLDPTQHPKEFNLKLEHPRTGKISVSKGIYRIDGDRLMLCYDNTGKTRPSKFESPDGREEIVLSVLKRSKR
jgi:uncharacterized protein (TIGR03067 family)